MNFFLLYLLINGNYFFINNYCHPLLNLINKNIIIPNQEISIFLEKISELNKEKTNTLSSLENLRNFSKIFIKNYIFCLIILNDWQFL